jgi:FtsH-binding integral membrane protein
MNTGVFERTSESIRSKELIDAVTYNLIIGAVLFWGFAVNWLMVYFIPAESIQSVNPLVFFAGYFGCCFLGISLFKKSSNPWISFLGYNCIVVPFGLVINVVVSYFDPVLVLYAMQITGIVTLLMIGLGATFPRFFEGISGALTMALLGMIVVELFEIFILGIHQGVIDWIVALIFCGYIGYDWGRANQIPKTIDNAVDSAAALYMDIINLFLRILRILGRKRR